jgi:murein DD-endopeptidase MepM/ murein hydrolase activator NlpD
MIHWYSKKFLVLLILFFGFLSSYSSAESLVHLVAKGETIYSIARSYRVSQEDLMRSNGIADASRLQAGMRLVIPSVTGNLPVVATVPAAAAPVTVPTVVGSAYSEYTVSRNDTLYSIARNRGVTLQALRDINGFSKNYVIKTGEIIKIPVPPGASIVTPRPPPVPIRTTPTRADPSIRWPVAAKEILYMSSNAGVLVSGIESESIKSLTGGTVVHASPWRGYGNVAVIEAGGGYRYLYGACETLSVKKGDSITPGTELGKLGIYPASGKPDLVFMVSQNGSPVDPAKAPRY